jgi:hypothetical protein
MLCIFFIVHFNKNKKYLRKQNIGRNQASGAKEKGLVHLAFFLSFFVQG